MAGAVVELLKEVNAAGQTIVIVTHDADIGAQARRLVRMQDGHIVDDAPTAKPRKATKKVAKAPARKRAAASAKA
jgi:ABC-type lipoprotein export system ATPase subunit